MILKLASPSGMPMIVRHIKTPATTFFRPNEAGACLPRRLKR